MDRVRFSENVQVLFDILQNIVYICSMKTCFKCKIPKSLNEFRTNKSKKDGYQHYCIECDKEFQAQWYQNNKEKCLTKAKTSNLKYRSENREYVIKYLKEHSCINCGEKDIVVLEFDHLRDKKCNVARLISSSTLHNVIKEINKCQVLCANCHKRKTAKDYNWYKLD